MDLDRFRGLKSELPRAELMVIPMEQEARTIFYREHFLKSVGLSVPTDMSVIGFDNVRE